MDHTERLEAAKKALASCERHEKTIEGLGLVAVAHALIVIAERLPAVEPEQTQQNAAPAQP